jgi:hypothetical protein
VVSAVHANAAAPGPSESSACCLLNRKIEDHGTLF